MSSPKLRLSRLRDIGWSLWDPIGLLASGTAWDDEDNLSFADEYDGYLIHVAGRLRQGACDADMIAYLIEMETERMALAGRSDAFARASAVVSAIHADKELWSYPDEK